MSLFKLSIREKLDRMSKKDLLEYRKFIFEGKAEHIGAEEKLELLRLIEERIGGGKRGRPKKAAEDKCSVQIKINVTPTEELELRRRMESLSYKKLSTYMRDMTLNLVPELQVNSIEKPDHDDELLEEVNEQVQLSGMQLLHAFQNGIIDQNSAQAIIQQLSLIQQSVIQREQRESGEYNADFVLTLANKYLDAGQLQMLADFKESKEQTLHH
ncbi:hypothetical protein [Vibrio cyclitrophicus]|uniref:hypothetical protein n=1 Tax=Vibrio cyclitrophicus TaxID=47951 RepID=UPI000C8609B2|nr:hypothetical protein [Vibrio cyclitrophicus]PMG84229.1 hypothetical protein BCU82_19775 [Vibrio cyclitrophicus]